VLYPGDATLFLPDLSSLSKEEGIAYDSESMIEVARVGATHGLQGGLHLNFAPGAGRVFQRGVRLEVSNQNLQETLTIDKFQSRNEDRGVVVFEEIQSLKTAETWVHGVACLSRSCFPSLSQGEIYLVDLLGWEIFTTGDSFEGPWKLEAFYFTPAHPVGMLSSQQGSGEIPIASGNVVEMIFENRKLMMNSPILKEMK